MRRAARLRDLRTLGIAALAGLTSTSLLAGCGDGSSPSASPGHASPVALKVADVPDHLRIGVMVTLTSSPGQGADWSDAAEGAQVAAYRYRLGSAAVDLVAVNDKGTADGARAAVDQLVGDHVAGIVFATTGTHLAAGLATAQAAGVASVLPYPNALALPDDAWTTAPDAAQIGKALSDRLASIGATSPVVIDAGGGLPEGVPGDHLLHYRAGSDPTRLASTVARLRHSAHVDAVVISGDAGSQATLSAAVQGAGLSLPVLLTPAALSPRFAVALDSAGGSLESGFTTVGAASPDTTAMAATTAGDAAAAYLSALRTAAGNPTLKDFFDARPFSTVAADADAASHDAVIALVSAAAKAKSTDPAAVLAALRTLGVTAADGLAGPALDFTRHDAVSDADVSVLSSTTQGTDLRPPSTQAQLYWFAEPGQ